MFENKNKSNVFLGGKFTSPEKIADEMELGIGSKVAVFGCGAGYFALSIARRMASGIVYALDVLKEKLESVESQAKLTGISNIVTKRVNLEQEKGSTLPPSSMDWVTLINVLFQNKNKDLLISEAKRVLKKSGKVLVVEWEDRNFPIGPDGGLRVRKDELKKIAQRNNLEIVKEFSLSEFHYGLILKK